MYKKPEVQALLKLNFICPACGAHNLYSAATDGTTNNRDICCWQCYEDFKGVFDYNVDDTAGILFWIKDAIHYLIKAKYPHVTEFKKAHADAVDIIKRLHKQ